MTLAVAGHLLPGSSDDERRSASRRVSHASIRGAADWIAGDTPPRHLGVVVTRLRRNSDLTDVAQAFRELQEEREKSDYDHEADLTRPGTHARIEQAGRAIRLLGRNEGSEDFRSFLGLVALKITLR